jgi:hypothetical protein
MRSEANGIRFNEGPKSTESVYIPGWSERSVIQNDLLANQFDGCVRDAMI